MASTGDLVWPYGPIQMADIEEAGERTLEPRGDFSEEGKAYRDMAMKRRAERKDSWLVGFGDGDSDSDGDGCATMPSRVATLGALKEALVPDWSDLTKAVADPTLLGLLGTYDEDDPSPSAANNGVPPPSPLLKMAEDYKSAAQKMIDDAMQASAAATQSYNEATAEPTQERGSTTGGGFGGGAASPEGAREMEMSAADQRAIAMILAGGVDEDQEDVVGEGGMSQPDAESASEEETSDSDHSEGPNPLGRALSMPLCFSKWDGNGATDGDAYAVLASGLMWSQGQNFGGWKQRWFELTATHLSYFTSTVYRAAANGTLKLDERPRAVIPLDGLEVDPGENGTREHCLSLTLGRQDRKGIGVLVGVWAATKYLVDPECEAEQAGWIYEIRLAVERLARRQAAQRNGGEQGESAGGLPSPTKGAVDLEALAIHTGDSRGTMVKIEKAGWLFLAKPPSRRSWQAKRKRSWKRSWVVLQGGRLRCYTSPQQRPDAGVACAKGCTTSLRLELLPGTIMLHSTRSRPFCLALSAVAAEKLEHEGESASSSDEEEKKPEQDLYRVHVIHMYLLECQSAAEQERWKSEIERQAYVAALSGHHDHSHDHEEVIQLSGEEEMEEQRQAEGSDEGHKELYRNGSNSSSSNPLSPGGHSDDAAIPADGAHTSSPKMMGWVWKESDHLKAWRRRWMTCENGVLRYAKVQAPGASQTEVSLYRAHVGPPVNVRDRPHCWRISLGPPKGEEGKDGSQTKYVLAVDDAVTKAKWLKVLRANVMVAGGELVPPSLLLNPTPSSPTSAAGGFQRSDSAVSSTSSLQRSDSGAESRGGQQYQCLGCQCRFEAGVGRTAEACPKCGSNFIVENSAPQPQADTSPH